MKSKSDVYGVEVLNGDDAWGLFEASAQGNVAEVKALLAMDRRLVNAQISYQFPIHLAVYAGNAEIVKLLLDRGADPGQSVYTYNSWNKLLLCAQERGHRRIESLLQRAMHKRFSYTPDFDALKDAILARDLRKISAVLRRRPDLVRASDALGNNPLHWSVITRQLGLIDRFVELGTPIDAKRADGNTPVLLAVNGATDYWYRSTRGRSHPSLRNTSVIVGSLLAHRAQYTISVAAAVGDQERVDELLLKDAGLARRLDSARVSPLSYAAREGHLHLVRLLLEHGADPNTPEDAAPNGRALFEACCRNHFQVAELLLEHGANPNAGTDSNGCCLTIGEVYYGDQAKSLQQLLRRHGAYTPPYAMSAQEMKQAIRDDHEAVRHEEFCDNVLRTQDLELVELYLDSDPTALDGLDFGSVVAWPRSPALVRKLLARGLDPNRTDWLGNTFLHACAELGNRSVAAVLIDAGADINAREVEFQGTPLAAAVRSRCAADDPKQAERQRRMVEFLLKRGARTKLPGDEPWATPLAWATRYGRGDLVELLNAAT
ncbi:MAG: ankyrin repeat domain-containing protein [Planctomycetales bacterium]